MIAVLDVLGAQLVLQVWSPAGSAATRRSGPAARALSWSFPRPLRWNHGGRRRHGIVSALTFIFLVDDIAVIARVVRFAAIIFLFTRIALSGTPSTAFCYSSSSSKVPRASTVNAQFPRYDRSSMLSNASARPHALSRTNCLGAMLPYRDCMCARDMVDGKYDTHRGEFVFGVKVTAFQKRPS